MVKVDSLFVVDTKARVTPEPLKDPLSLFLDLLCRRPHPVLLNPDLEPLADVGVHDLFVEGRGERIVDLVVIKHMRLINCIHQIVVILFNIGDEVHVSHGQLQLLVVLAEDILRLLQFVRSNLLPFAVVRVVFCSHDCAHNRSWVAAFGGRHGRGRFHDRPRYWGV